MGLDALLATLESRASDTPDTPQNDNAKRKPGPGPSLADLEAAAGPDWSDVRDRPAALAALAGLLRTKAQRDRGEVPHHYTQSAMCATCGHVWLWEGAPARVVACPWCLTRPKGAPTPQSPAAPGPDHPERAPC